jgi:hypothetical protein
MPTDSMVAATIWAMRRDPTRSSADLAAAVRRTQSFVRDATSLGTTRRGSPPPGTTVRASVLLFLLALAGLALMLAGLR